MSLLQGNFKAPVCFDLTTTNTENINETLKFAPKSARFEAHLSLEEEEAPGQCLHKYHSVWLHTINTHLCRSPFDENTSIIAINVRFHRSPSGSRLDKPGGGREYCLSIADKRNQYWHLTVRRNQKSCSLSTSLLLKITSVQLLGCQGWERGGGLGK